MLEWETVRQIDKLQGPSINKEETQNLHTQGFRLILFSFFLIFISSSRFLNSITYNFVFNKGHELLYYADES